MIDDLYVGSAAVTVGADFPANGGEAVVPDDTTKLTHVSRAIYVGVSGNVCALMRDGTTVTFLSMAIGWHPIRVQRINLTTPVATTATNIISVY